MGYLISTRKACADVQTLDDKAAGLPRKGTHVGGGVHVDLDHPDRRGWTLHERGVIKHPVKDQHAYALSEKTPTSLTTAEKAAYDAAKAAAVPVLPEDWSTATAAQKAVTN